MLRYTVIAAKGRKWLDTKFMPWFGPLALLSLVYTVLVLFALQVRNAPSTADLPTVTSASICGDVCLSCVLKVSCSTLISQPAICRRF